MKWIQSTRRGERDKQNGNLRSKCNEGTLFGSSHWSSLWCRPFDLLQMRRYYKWGEIGTTFSIEGRESYADLIDAEININEWARPLELSSSKISREIPWMIDDDQGWPSCAVLPHKATAGKRNSCAIPSGDHNIYILRNPHRSKLIERITLKCMRNLHTV
jgi:hypothetical protein